MNFKTNLHQDTMIDLIILTIEAGKDIKEGTVALMAETLVDYARDGEHESHEVYFAEVAAHIAANGDKMAANVDKMLAKKWVQNVIKEVQEDIAG